MASNPSQSQHVLLQPFNEVVKWARIASKQAAFSYGGGDHGDYIKSPMSMSAQSLLREGERALRRLSPLIENPSSHLSQHLRNLMMKNEEMSGKLRAINVTLYDFEDYIEPETYEKSKFLELESATRDLALTLVEHITTFTTQSALDPLPASKFPALPPLPPMPSVPGMQQQQQQQQQPRPDSRMTTRTNTTSHRNGAPPPPHSGDLVQRRPSHGARSDGRDEYSRQVQTRSAAYSDSASPVSPIESPAPFSQQHVLPHGEQDRARNDYQWQRTHRQRPSNGNVGALPVMMDHMDIGVVTPPSSVLAASQTSPHYRGSGYSKGRGSNGFPYQDTPPGSDVASDGAPGYPFPPAAEAGRAYMSLSPLDSASMMINDHAAQPHRHLDAELLQRESLGTHMYSFSERSAGSNEPPRHSTAASISSGTVKTGDDSMSAKSVSQSPRKLLSGNEIGPLSSINALGGFCKSARHFASAGPGRAIKRVGAMEGQGGSGPGPGGQDFSQEMLFGSMLGATGAETSSDPTAQCQSCSYKTLYSNLRQDIEQDPLVTQQARGIYYRPRFLWKSHVAVKGLDVFFGCLFCDKAKATCHDGDATVFQSVDLLMRHVSRHPRPLPQVPGLTVLYETEESGPVTRQNYDVLFPASTPPALYTGLPASEVDRIAALPAAVANKDNIRRRDERPLAKPDSGSAEVLAFLGGARILGVEYPERWQGKWCQGWHDGAFGVFPSKLVSLEAPYLVNTAALPKTLRTGVTRWRFEAKTTRKDSGWLTFGKGETIYNLAWDDPHAWFWSGSNSKGQCGIFPKTHIAIDSIEDGSLGPTNRNSAPKEKSRFRLFGKR